MRACLILILIPILVLGYADASKISVGPKDADYSNIQQAIDNSSQGDIIDVQSGLYRENVFVYKTLTLEGIDTGSGLPVIDAGKSGSVISITSNDSIVEGFNVTGSGGCGCGNAGIKVQSSNNIVKGNTISKNKYGIYIQSGCENNTFIANDLRNNDIAVSDSGFNNRWNASAPSGGLQGLLAMIGGSQSQPLGNHYSDYDEVAEGCNDTNQDKICDQPRIMGSGPDKDNYPVVSSKS